MSRLESLVFPVASPGLWGQLQNLSFSKVSNCENWRKSHTKCSFFCAHVSRLESLVFLWPRRVYGGRYKISSFRMFPPVKIGGSCSFWCSHLSRFESLVFWWLRRVYGGSYKISPSQRFSSRLSIVLRGGHGTL